MNDVIVTLLKNTVFAAAVHQWRRRRSACVKAGVMHKSIPHAEIVSSRRTESIRPDETATTKVIRPLIKLSPGHEQKHPPCN